MDVHEKYTKATTTLTLPTDEEENNGDVVCSYKKFL